jgi:hypothetical protein
VLFYVVGVFKKKMALSTISYYQWSGYKSEGVLKFKDSLNRFDIFMNDGVVKSSIGVFKRFVALKKWI